MLCRLVDADLRGAIRLVGSNDVVRENGIHLALKLVVEKAGPQCQLRKKYLHPRPARDRTFTN